MPSWKPQNNDYASIFDSANPWHFTGEVPAELAPPTWRPLAESLWRPLLRADSRRHQIILGPRRVGKTTAMYQTLKALLDHKIEPRRLWWLRLDHPLLLEWPLGDLVRQIVTLSEATPSRPAYLFLDEITYSQRWDLWLKTFFDEQWPVRIAATSSATAAIRQRGTESGVGRWDEHYLAPYLFTEYLDLKGIDVPTTPVGSDLCDSLRRRIADATPLPQLEEHRNAFLLTGGFPELLLAPRRAHDPASETLRSQQILRSDAIEKSLYKDIPQAFSIQEPTKLERLLYVLAGQVTGIVSPTSIGADIALTAPTVEKYVGYLERAFLIFSLQNYASTEEARQRRGRKLYFVDGAVRNAALLRGIAPLNDPAEYGRLIENMIGSHLRALALQEGVRVYYWRDARRHEIDFIYDHPTHPIAFEVTGSERHSEDGLRAFQQVFPKFRGRTYLVSSRPERRLPDPEEPGSVSIDDLLLAIGRQEQEALHRRIGRPGDASGQLRLF